MTSSAESTSQQASQHSYKDPLLKLILKYAAEEYHVFHSNWDISFNKWWERSNSAHYVRSYYGEISKEEKEKVKKRAAAITVKELFDALENAQKLPVETVPSITDAGAEGFNMIACVLSGLVAGGCIISMLTGLFVTDLGALTPVGVGLCCGIGLGIFFTLATLCLHWMMTCTEGSTRCGEKWFKPKAKDSFLVLARDVLSKLKNIDQVLGKQNAISVSQDKSFVETYSAKHSLLNKLEANKAKTERQKAAWKQLQGTISRDKRSKSF